GLNSLGIDSLEKKQIFVTLNHQIYQEKNNFGLSTKEKENILSFIHNTLNLTPEQRQALEKMGIKPYNATDSLKTFTLTEEQKNILHSLAPLTREEKHSKDSLQLLNSLALKPKHLTFFTNEEIIPNPNLDFGEITSPYLPLKI
ncbi:11168_t:CDS:2, partial [Ambispora leptoticha]